MRSGASGVARLDPPFVVLYSALSVIAHCVNVLRRTRRKPSTIGGAAPDVVIGQSTAARAGARPYQQGQPRMVGPGGFEDKLHRARPHPSSRVSRNLGRGADSLESGSSL